MNYTNIIIGMFSRSYNMGSKTLEIGSNKFSMLLHLAQNVGLIQARVRFEYFRFFHTFHLE